tara:strand:- start:8774 stop:9559 length:786 start_codon:yes stop_codon:yes gene_type:complete
MNDLLGVFDSSHYANLAVNNQENFKKANPFPHIYLDNFLPENIAEEVSNSIPSPYDDTFDWISRDRENEVKQKMQFDEIKLPFSVRMILREFNSKQFLLFLETLTGIDNLIPDPYFIGGGIHVAMKGDFLKVHADHNWHYKLYTHRRVNALLYLSQKDWIEDWGGHLEMWDEKMTGPQASIAPFFNRLVVFETTDKTNHGRPDPLNCPEGVYRKALNLYYYTSKRDNAEISDPHFTLYRTENSPYDVENKKEYIDQGKNKS